LPIQKIISNLKNKQLKNIEKFTDMR